MCFSLVQENPNHDINQPSGSAQTALSVIRDLSKEGVINGKLNHIFYYLFQVRS